MEGREQAGAYLERLAATLRERTRTQGIRTLAALPLEIPLVETGRPARPSGDRGKPYSSANWGGGVKLLGGIPPTQESLRKPPLAAILAGSYLRRVQRSISAHTFMTDSGRSHREESS